MPLPIVRETKSRTDMIGKSGNGKPGFAVPDYTNGT